MSGPHSEGPGRGPRAARGGARGQGDGPRARPGRVARAARTGAGAARRGDEPSAVEHSLDHLWDSPADRRDARVEGLKTLGRLGLGVARAIRDGDLPDPSSPEWLEPPTPAFYVLPLVDRWSRVSPDDGSEDRLERIHQAGHSQVTSTTVLTAWLQPGPDGLAVFIGQERVGTVPADAYTRTVEAASFRGSSWSCKPGSPAGTSSQSTCSKSRSRPREEQQPTHLVARPRSRQSS